MANVDAVYIEEKETPAESAPVEKPLEEDASIDEEELDNEESEDSDEEVSEDEIVSESIGGGDKTVPYSRFKEVNEKAKKLEAELKEAKESQVDEDDLDTRIKKSLESYVGPLSQEVKKIREKEVTSTLRGMMTKHPDFKKNWDKIKTLIPVFENSGTTYSEAVENAYFLSKKKEYQSSPDNSSEGVMSSTANVRSSGGGDEKLIPEQEEAYRLSGLSQERIKELKEKGYDI